MRIRQEWHAFVVQMKDTNKMTAAMLFTLYTLLVLKMAVALAVILMDIVEVAAENATIGSLPMAIWEEAASRIQPVLIDYSPVQQVGICIIAFAVLNVLFTPAALWLDFSTKTIFSSNLNWKEKCGAIRDEACRLFNICVKKIDQSCVGIVKVAGITFIAWVVWSLLAK